MVTTLAPQFAQLHQRIGIETKAAVEAHADVRAKLHSDPKLQEWGVDTVLIGSYKRKTSIFPCHDVDVFVKLPKCPAGTTPEAVFTEVERVLKAAYGSRATEQRRSMKVDGFPEDLSVDAVPAVPDGSRCKIPQTSGAKVGTRLIKDSWETTDPERLTDLTNDRQAKGPVIDGEPSYRRSVRMIRQIREAHLKDAHPGGLYFELLTYWAFPSVTATSSYSELVTDLLERIAASLASALTVLDPALGTPYEPQPTAIERTTAAGLFAGLAKTARAALSKDECPAALDWQRTFGENSRYPVPVFPLPPNCAADGTRIQALPRSDRGSNVDRPFA